MQSPGKMVQTPVADSILETVSARLVDLLFLGSRILPTLQGPDHVRFAPWLALVSTFECEKRAFDKELAARAAPQALASSLGVNRQDKAGEEPIHLAIKRTV